MTQNTKLLILNYCSSTKGIDIGQYRSTNILCNILIVICREISCSYKCMRAWSLKTWRIINWGSIIHELYNDSYYINSRLFWLSLYTQYCACLYLGENEHFRVQEKYLMWLMCISSVFACKFTEMKRRGFENCFVRILCSTKHFHQIIFSGLLPCRLVWSIA